MNSTKYTLNINESGSISSVTLNTTGRIFKLGESTRDGFITEFIYSNSNIKAKCFIGSSYGISEILRYYLVDIDLLTS